MATVNCPVCKNYERLRKLIREILDGFEQYVNEVEPDVKEYIDNWRKQL